MNSVNLAPMIPISQPEHYFIDKTIYFDDLCDSMSIYYWCSENLSGRFWVNSKEQDWVTRAIHIMYEFELEQDAVLFALKWK